MRNPKLILTTAVKLDVAHVSPAPESIHTSHIYFPLSEVMDGARRIEDWVTLHSAYSPSAQTLAVSTDPMVIAFFC